MTLILLAISLTIAMCVIAYNFAIYALPFMVGLSAFQYVHGMEAGFLMSGLAAIGAALLSVALVIAEYARARMALQGYAAQQLGRPLLPVPPQARPPSPAQPGRWAWRTPPG